jgi:hypothetical protein
VSLCLAVGGFSILSDDRVVVTAWLGPDICLLEWSAILLLAAVAFLWFFYMTFPHHTDWFFCFFYSACIS